MSLAESPVQHSSSSDDFTVFLERAQASSDCLEPSPDEEGDGDIESGRSKRRRIVESLGSIEETLGYSTSQVFVEKNSEASPKKDICAHPGSYGDLCIVCGQRVDNKSGEMKTLAYIHPKLKLDNDEIDGVRSTDIKKLLRREKLYLVLDLDHTLLNSTQMNHLTPDEEYLQSQTVSLQGSLFRVDRVDSLHRMIKLRPFIRTFLKAACAMFEMYIYTMGARDYALEMAKLLDPRKEYFGDRVISRDDSTDKHQKDLDILIVQESAVLILDDTDYVWKKHADNLVLMERYDYFRSGCHRYESNFKSLSELKRDESELEGALATVLEVLKRVHRTFFYELEDNLIDRDVRQVLKTLRKEILKECVIVFSRFTSKFQTKNDHLWKMAEQMGATCLIKVDPSVTHVVSAVAEAEKSRWAVKKNKFLVHPQWIQDANYRWQKQPEEKFPVQQMETQKLQE